VNESTGRVLDLTLTGGDRACHLQFQLIPKAFNLLVQAGDKKISWEKPRDLPLSQTLENQEIPHIDWKEKGQHWLQGKFNIRAEGKKAGSDPRLKAIEKKRKALLAIEEQLKEDPSENWQRLGESLKISPQVPEDLQGLYNAKKSKSWNLENAFSQAKFLEKKRKGTEARLEKLKIEIQELESDVQKNPEPSVLEKPASQGSRLLSKTQSKGRRIQFDEGFEAVMGKSASDNLAILRKAQAWDLWLHLKDYPVLMPSSCALATKKFLRRSSKKSRNG
jgi:hypothetical protein